MGMVDQLFSRSLQSYETQRQQEMPLLEYLDLDLGNGDPLRPVVGDGPGREVMLRRPARKRPRTAEQRFKLLGDRRGRFEERPGHVASIAPAGGKQNGP